MAVAQAQQIRDLIAEAVASAGLIVEDVHLSPAGRRTVVRITVDLPETEVGGVPVDSVADAARAVSDTLDATDVMGGAPYVLEVTSPGVDRSLTERRHWARARGRLVTVVLREGGELRGRLVSVGDDGPTIDEHLVAWTAVSRGRVEIEFRRDDDVDGDEPADDSGEEED